MNQIVSLDPVQFFQQIGKIAILPRILSVRIHVLTKQGNIPIALGYQRPHLGDDLVSPSASLPSANVRNDAVRAKIVTAVHDRHPRAKAAFSMHGNPLGNEVFRLVRTQDPLSPSELFAQKFGESVDRRRAEQNIHVRIFEFDIVDPMLLHHHAAANNDDQLGIFRLQMLVLSHQGKRPLLRMLANGAGVDHNEPSFLGSIGHFISHCHSHACQPFAVRLVLLTAKGQYEGAGTASVLCQIPLVFRKDPRSIFLLPFHFLCGNRTAFFHHFFHATTSLYLIYPQKG